MELLSVDNRSEPRELSLGQIGASIGENLERVLGDLKPEESVNEDDEGEEMADLSGKKDPVQLGC